MRRQTVILVGVGLGAIFLLAAGMLFVGMLWAGGKGLDTFAAPEKITWDVHKGFSAADIGWHPKDRFDIGYDYSGDIDFTLIEHDADGSGKFSVFHQRCYAIAASREALPPRENQIDGITAYFAMGVTVEDGIELARKVIVEFSGGLREDLPHGELSLDQIREGIKNGTFHDAQFSVQGRAGEVVTITITGAEPPSAGLKRTCSLLFR